jgi:hypothetical protein
MAALTLLAHRCSAHSRSCRCSTRRQRSPRRSALGGVDDGAAVGDGQGAEVTITALITDIRNLIDTAT